MFSITIRFIIPGQRVAVGIYSNAAVVPCVRACVRRSVRASVRGPCEHDRDYIVACFFVKLGRHVNHDERMNPIDFGGQRSRSQWTYMEISL